MKDFLSKVTFGFLMAQFVPGVIVVLSISLLFSASDFIESGWMLEVISSACGWWLGSTAHILFFIMLSVGAGMMIHGIHWAVLAFHAKDRCNLKVCYFPEKPAWFHVIVGPPMIAAEMFILFFHDLTHLSTRENVGNVDKDKMQAFNFLQEFYLNFSQFYAHTSYALFASTILLIALIIGFNAYLEYWYLPLLLYIFTGVFYLLGRIQMLTLFASERELCIKQENTEMDKDDDAKPVDINIEQMAESDAEQSVQLVSDAMNEEESRWARDTFEYYFMCLGQGVKSERKYFVWKNDNIITGLVGLHRYRWGPPENVWLSWFAVHPDHQGRGIGSALISFIENKAKEIGYKKIFIETYGEETFAKARKFYEKKGFCKVGEINNYLTDDSSMIVFGKVIK